MPSSTFWLVRKRQSHAFLHILVGACIFTNSYKKAPFLANQQLRYSFSLVLQFRIGHPNPTALSTIIVSRLLMQFTHVKHLQQFSSFLTSVKAVNNIYKCFHFLPSSSIMSIIKVTMPFLLHPLLEQITLMSIILPWHVLQSLINLPLNFKGNIGWTALIK